MTEQENVQTQEAVVETNPLERTLELTVSFADSEKLVKDYLRMKAKTAKMPGFRKGHVPMNMVQQMYGAEAFDEAVNMLVAKAWEAAVKEGNLRVAGYPTIKSVASEDKALMKFEATYEVYPDVEIPDFSQYELKKFVCPVTDEDVEQTLKVMQRQRATFKVVEREAQDGDRLTINFEGKINGEAFQGGTAKGYVFELGQGRMLQDFEDAIKGMKAEEKKTFTMTFPADYGIEHLNGSDAEFEIEVLKVEEAVLPELDDEFAKSLGIENGVDAMRKEIRSNLEREVQARLEMKNKQETMEVASQACVFPVPQTFVEAEVESMAESMRRDLQARGVDVAKMPELDKSFFKDQALRRVRLGLFVSALVEKENVTGTDEQVRELAQNIASSYEQPDEVVTYIMNDKERVERLRAQITETNVSNWIMDHAKSTEEKLDFSMLMSGQI